MSNKIKSILVLKGISVRAFAKMMNVHEATIRRKMNGTSPLFRDDIINFSKALELSSEEVMRIFLPELLQ